ncbi:MAG: hypothetical protein F7B61_06505 [Caldisphaeraceae archaeon]|nr:hypothetical protein [Caldisphaeraceae archaeon]
MASEKIRLSGKEVYELLSNVISVSSDDFAPLFAKKLNAGPFSVLVSIILTQNTTERNALKAFKNLFGATKLNPQQVLSLRVEELSKMIRVAGLSMQKASAILRLSSYVIEKGEEHLLSEDPAKLRDKLISIPGIGEKTADVFLSLYRKYPVFPVDTHIRRISIRWGLVDKKSSYKEISSALINFFDPSISDKAHRLMIAFGRTYCRSKDPRCWECPLRKVCPHAQT